ncbi:hypothetical protein [Yaniella halotolerans]|uniref:hypothetical protein n=1 Tax=Yaniella halotolerans TaxID=225453 RepID=UPI0003B78DE8|nr:hypothetical protein [Yaniella halotolerans]
MTAVPRFSSIPTTGAERPAIDFSVGGADPDFVALESSKPAICAVPMLGKMLSQCK